MLNLNDICCIFIIWNLGDNQPEKLPPGVYYSNTELAVLYKNQSISLCLILKECIRLYLCSNTTCTQFCQLPNVSEIILTPVVVSLEAN